MYYHEGELKTLIDLLIKYHESFYLMNQQKAEDGLNGLIDVFEEYIEVIQLLIENNQEKRIIKDVNQEVNALINFKK